MINWIERLEGHGQIFWVLVGLSLTALVGVLDHLTGYELGLSLFYLIPVFLVTWFTGRTLGLLIALACAVAWYISDQTAGNPYSNILYGYWNSAVRLSIFVIVALLLSALKDSQQSLQNLARLDPLTGLSNSRFFRFLAQREVDRCARYGGPLSLVYFDLDNFKAVNDRYGHGVGDTLLCLVAEIVTQQLRATDIVARLGGDEFAVLLPQTDAEHARSVVTKFQQAVVDGMQARHWPVTISAGLLTCTEPPASLDEMLRQADELMYQVKRDGKNGIATG